MEDRIRQTTPPIGAGPVWTTPGVVVCEVFRAFAASDRNGCARGWVPGSTRPIHSHSCLCGPVRMQKFGRKGRQRAHCEVSPGYTGDTTMHSDTTCLARLLAAQSLRAPAPAQVRRVSA